MKKKMFFSILFSILALTVLADEGVKQDEYRVVERIKAWQDFSFVYVMAFTPDGCQLLTMTYALGRMKKSAIKVYDFEEKRAFTITSPFLNHDDIKVSKFNDTGTRIGILFRYGDLFIFDYNQKKHELSLCAYIDKRPFDFMFLPENQGILVAIDNELIHYDLEDGTSKEIAKTESYIRGVGFNPETRLVTTSHTSDVELHGKDGKKIYKIEHDGIMQDIVPVSSDGRRVISRNALIDRENRIWGTRIFDIETGKYVFDIPKRDRDSTIEKVSFSGDNAHLLFRTTRGALQIYNLEKKSWSVFPETENLSSIAALSHDGKRLAIMADGGDLLLLEKKD